MDATTDNAAGEKPAGGLRARKKERTRDDLASAAVALFIERGYDATTVDDIAAAVDVSARTFFRYFPTKEDVVVDFLRAGSVDLSQELAQRPVDEPLPTALRSATQHWAQATEAAGDRAKQLRQLLDVLRSAPLLRARFDDERHRKTAAIAAIVASRLGVDAATDPRPQLIASLVSTVIGSSIERWIRSGGSLVEHVAAGFDLLECGLPCSGADTARSSRDRAPAG